MLSIYNKISDYIIILKQNGEIIFCNESFLKRLNYSEYDILNLNINEILIETKQDIINIVKKSDPKDKILEFYSKSKDTIKINSKISIENFNDEKNIFIIGKEINSRPYTIEILEDLLDNINIGTFIVNPKGKYLYVNKAFSDMLNKKRDDIIGSYSNDYWKYNICKELDKNNKEIFKNKSPKILNEKLEFEDTENWYESYKCPIYDENGFEKYIIATTQNINLPKTLSEELYKNYNSLTNKHSIDYSNVDYNNNLNKILSEIGEHILNYTIADGISILLYNEEREGLIPIIKLKKSNIYLKNIDFIPFSKSEVYSDKYRSYFNKIIKKEKINNTSTVNYNRLDDIDYSGNYAIELYDEFIGIIGLSYSKGNKPKFNSDEYMKHICNKIAMIIQNIRLSYEVSIENKKRRYTERELEKYLNVSVDLVAIVGRDEYLKRISPNWCNVLGWTEKELLSMPITNIIHEEELQKFAGKNKLENIDKGITRNIIRFRHKNGNYIYLEWSSEYIYEDDVYITTARDITKKLEIEKEKKVLEETVKLEIIKNEFFSNISHEFRTPINIILGTMQVINKNIEKGSISIDSLKKHTNYIRQNSYRLLRLVNNLIDISKMDIGMYELRCCNQNIISIIEDITLSVAGYTKNNKINLVFDTDIEEVITYCDPDKIERIMLNILSNAIKYTPEYGDIEVKINYNEDEILVSIKDSGVGIPKDKLDIIFDRFGQVNGSFNRKYEGSGIGLSLVKNLVEMHGGKVSVNSKVNKGSEFTFSIPIRVEKSTCSDYDADRKYNHVERCEIEFSDIYSMSM
ncbi:PAS domain-containing sensor histidine kinase [Romboutsia sp. 1001713B170207_170306_H8]|uniref:PAS domain-containing sensor histidine kinase n=1 Tax=Romboutsia sp. 1001713B170207_170306_H8 TaxID=2787112 RepID=UPI0018971315|nr:ATP-binding protein [Romboutsia sp. 1001713B170207_170306_H8]